MKNNLFLPIAVGLVCFGIALWQYTGSCGDQIYDWWFCLSFLGRVATVGVGLCIAWTFYNGIFNKKR